MKTNSNNKGKKTNNLILFFIFLACVIPTIYIYQEHGWEELETAGNTTTSDYKKTKALGEGILFLLIAGGYTGFTLALIIFPYNRVPYLVLIVGTVAIIILYYMRIYGIPVIGTEVVIRDLSTDWRDVITKICQQIMVIPLSIMLITRCREDKVLALF